VLAGGDLVAGSPDRVDGDLHFVPKLADAGDDVVVLVLKGLEVLRPRQQVIESVGLQQHRDQVGLA
jgi:hypothetical protein